MPFSEEAILRAAYALVADDWTGERLYDAETAKMIAKTVIYGQANDEDKAEAIKRVKLVVEALEGK